MNDTLFELPRPETPRPPLEAKGEPRLQRPNREQVEVRPVDLEGLLPADHRAR
ncbi:MAG: IS5/IS1182 family transposase, partial [Candidatus Rokubacteria bacterium]|nr:IS5/IS1182 family transposase [Candidatus Rokubacteria bacterium]